MQHLKRFAERSGFFDVHIFGSICCLSFGYEREVESQTECLLQTLFGESNRAKLSGEPDLSEYDQARIKWRVFDGACDGRGNGEIRTWIAGIDPSRGIGVDVF